MSVDCEMAREKKNNVLVSDCVTRKKLKRQQKAIDISRILGFGQRDIARCIIRSIYSAGSLPADIGGCNNTHKAPTDDKQSDTQVAVHEVSPSKAPGQGTSQPDEFTGSNSPKSAAVNEGFMDDENEESGEGERSRRI